MVGVINSKTCPVRIGTLNMKLRLEGVLSSLHAREQHLRRLFEWTIGDMLQD